MLGLDDDTFPLPVETYKILGGAPERATAGDQRFAALGFLLWQFPTW